MVFGPCPPRTSLVLPLGVPAGSRRHQAPKGATCAARAHGADKAILILDNHDDFGGHARRNEFTVDGKKLITYGGSQTLVEPYAAGPEVMRLFNDIGVALDRFDSAFDRDFYRRHGLTATTYFSAKRFGKDVVVRHPFTNYYNFIEGLPGQQLSDDASLLLLLVHFLS